MSQNPDVYRLFFALWPDEALREQIRVRCEPAMSRCGGRRVPLRNLHVTLLFIGDVPQARLTQALAVGAAIAAPAFDLSLDRIETPARGRVAWLGASRPEGAVGALASQLRLSHLSDEHERPYRAHLTLVRDPVRRLPPTSIEPVGWPVREFVLVRSQLRRGGAGGRHPGQDPGAEYEVLARWPLHA